MGEHADEIINGTCCEGCGIYMGKPTGFPRRCTYCKTEEKQKTNYSMNQEIQDLIALGYKVERFTDHHYRIMDVVDVWPTKRKFHFIGSDKRGVYENLISFTKKAIGSTSFFSRPIQVFPPENIQLRDQIAIAAMQVELGRHNYLINSSGNSIDLDCLASKSYNIADAMLEARKVKTQEDQTETKS